MGPHLEKMDEGPFASINSHESESEFSYFYTTKKPFENDNKEKKNLLCIDEPKFSCPIVQSMDPHSVCPGRIEEEIENFASSTYGPYS